MIKFFKVKDFVMYQVNITNTDRETLGVAKLF